MNFAWNSCGLLSKLLRWSREYNLPAGRSKIETRMRGKRPLYPVAYCISKSHCITEFLFSLPLRMVSSFLSIYTQPLLLCYYPVHLPRFTPFVHRRSLLHWHCSGGSMVRETRIAIPRRVYDADFTQSSSPSRQRCN